MTKIILSILLLFALSSCATSKQQKIQAFQLSQKAMVFLSEDKPNESITLLDQAIQLDPDNIRFKYEKALALYTNKKYFKAISIVKPLIETKDASDTIYQLLGNAYYFTVQREKARKTYTDGLLKFPDSGRLYLEEGVLALETRGSSQAIKFWEKGISGEPTFPSNYYWAVKFYAESEDKIWAVLYGEIFMNLEKTSRRRDEISVILYNIYDGAIHIADQDEPYADFTSMPDLSLYEKKNIQNFENAFDITMTQSVVDEIGNCSAKPLTLSCLSSIRMRFLELWSDESWNYKWENRYENMLLDWQKIILENGYLDMYNHWLFDQGNITEFNEWRSTHPGEEVIFYEWMQKRHIPITKNNYFSRFL